MEKQLEKWVQEANSGHRESLEKVINGVKDLVYNLSLKMLLYPEDAKDATQEILVRIITHLSTFEGKSQFKTWAYRVATNYLLSIKGKKSRQFAMSFTDYEKLIDTGQSDRISYTQNLGEQSLLTEEVKVSCTHGLLLCLDESHRIVYILSEIMDFNSLEGAAILEISAENFRKRLSRAREKIRNFLTAKCGLANPQNPCRCKRKVDHLINEQVIDPLNIRFAHQSGRSLELFNKIEQLEKSTAIYRSVAAFEAPEEVFKKIQVVINELEI